MRAGLAAACALGLLLATPAPAAARGIAPLLAGARLTLALPPPTRTGQPASLSGRLVSPAGPLYRTPVHLFIDGRFALTLETGAGGWLWYAFPRDLAAGDHPVALEYHGSRPRGLSPAAAGGVLTILPIEITLQAVPPIPGAGFTVDGRTYTTDASGAAHATLAAIGGHQLAVTAPAGTDSARYSFARWFDGVSVAAREIRVYDDGTIAATFSGALRVPISFRDSEGAPVDPRRVSDVSLLGPDGETVQVTPSQRWVWLTVPAPASAPRQQAAAAVRYSLASARFDGVSVANRGDDGFTPAPGRDWVVRLRVYRLRAWVRRPLFGGAPGHVVVRSSAGVERLAATGASGVAVIGQLPRDLYTVSPAGDQLGAPAMVEVTRDQQVDLTWYTAGEVGVGTLGLVLAAVGAFALWLLARRRPLPRGWARAGAAPGARGPFLQEQLVEESE